MWRTTIGLLFVLFLLVTNLSLSQENIYDKSFPGNIDFYNKNPRVALKILGNNSLTNYNIDETINQSGSLFLRYNFVNSSDNIFDILKVSNAKDNGILVKYDRNRSIFKVIFINSNGVGSFEYPYNYDTIKTTSIGLTWFYSESTGGFANFYIEGRLMKCARINENVLPLELNKISLCCIINNLEFGLWYDYLSQDDIESISRKGINVKLNYPLNLRIKGYRRDTINLFVLDASVSDSIIWGVNRLNLSEFVYSLDKGSTFKSYHLFKGRIRLVKVINDYIFVIVDSIVYRVKKWNNDFVEVLKFNEGRYPVNEWSFACLDSVVFLAEYGRSINSARLFKSINYGTTWEVVLTLTEGSDHIHAVKIDPYSKFMWVTYGDKLEGTLISRNLGVSWEQLFTSYFPQEDQMIEMLFYEDKIVFASDATTSGCFLAELDKLSNIYQKLSPIVPLYLTNVYALGKTDNKWIWWYGNFESVNSRHSSLFISIDEGKRPILLEDLYFNKIDYGYSFYQLGNFLFIGSNRIHIPSISEIK